MTATAATPGPAVARAAGAPRVESLWRRPAVRRLRSWAGLAALVLAAVVLWPQQYGGVTAVTVVVGSSMEPTYSGGDLLLTRDVAPRLGDVAVYRVPGQDAGAGALVVHRVVGGDGAAGWVTQGDNNAAPDVWTPRDADVLGTVALHLPLAGHAVLLLRDPLLWAAAGGVHVGYLLWPRAATSAPTRPRAAAG